MKPDQLGPYRVGRQVGQGGMGTVYEGVAIETGEPAAIKILSAHLAREEGFRERFAVEIETLKKLRHPNIVRLFGYGEQDGHLFYAMELVQGASLEEELRRGRRFDWKEATRIAVKMCRALKHAHDHGVIHRDIKPANLLLAAEGEVKLSDFGIAKLFGSTGMTATGGVLGTAEYMAPEQADGRPVTPRADLYSLGGVLYALLARRPPFVARSIVEMLHMQRYAEPEPIRRFNADVPEELESIISDLLAKDPDHRIRSAMILGRRLEAMEHGLAHREKRRAMNGAGGATFTDGDAPVPPAQADDFVPPDPLAATRAATEVKAPPSEARDDRPPSQADGRAELADVSTDTSAGGAAAAQPAGPAKPATAAARFTTVEEDEQREGLITWKNPDGSLFSPQTGLLVLALLLLSAAIWWNYQPPDKESLYETVSAAAANGKAEELVTAEQEINDFLQYYPSDRRCREMENYLEDIELHRLERRLERRVRQQAQDDALTPVERTYVEAIRHAQLDPERAAADLQALIDLYEDEAGVPDSTSRCLVLAARRLKRFQEQIEQHVQQHRKVLDERLARASALAATQPDRARRICEGLIDLFGDRPWAADQVARAREQLGRLETQGAEPAP